MPVLRTIRAFPGVNVGIKARINKGAEAQRRDEQGEDDA